MDRDRHLWARLRRLAGNRLRGKHQEVLRTGHRRPDRGEAGFLRRATNKLGTRDAPRRAYPEPTRQPPERSECEAIQRCHLELDDIQGSQPSSKLSDRLKFDPGRVRYRSRALEVSAISRAPAHSP